MVDKSIIASQYITLLDLLDILIPVYKQANHLLQLINDKRIRSNQTWEMMEDIQRQLLLLSLRLESAELPLEVVSQVCFGRREEFPI